MVQLAVTDIADTGTDLLGALVAAAAGGDSFVNEPGGDDIFIVVTNGDVALHTVTVADQTSQTPVGAAAFNPDMEITVPAGETHAAGPFPATRFNDNNGQVQLSYDAVVALTIGVFTLK